MDELEPDAALLVGSPEEGGRDLDLREGAVEHDGPLHEREVRPLIERSLPAEEIDVMWLQLGALALLDRLAFNLRLDAALDEVPDG